VATRTGRPDRRLTPARAVAFRVLRRVTADDAWADRAFRAEAERAGLDPRERAFAQQLAYGTVQRLRTIDHALQAASSRPLKRVDARLLDALRLGAFQLLFLDGVPDHAAVEQTVELVKKESNRASGFANAVMRRVSREGRAAVEAIDASTPEGAALALSHPDWVARMWWDQLGPDGARELMARNNEAPESALRANTLVTSPDALAAAVGVPSHAAPGVPEGLVLDAPWDAHGSSLFARGALIPQSRGSMTVARVLDPQPGDRVLDMCAAPGAKTTHIAALMGAEGRVVAMEQNAQRADALRANCERMRVAGTVEVVTGDAREAPAGPFDRILIDPPCSDLGTLQSRPDVRWRKTAEQVAELAALQRELLDAALDRLGPRGTLVYSSCTISPPENEDQIERLLAERPDVERDDLTEDRPEVAHPSVPGYLQMLPHRDGADGFFIARLRRCV
jgi:16S rRNA (cytosine967-C5)-methyltransferase